jgi:hypothetical protein
MSSVGQGDEVAPPKSDAQDDHPQRAKYLEKERHDVSAEDVKAYSANRTAHLTLVPSGLFWNADETRVGSAKDLSPRT